MSTTNPDTALGHPLLLTGLEAQNPLAWLAAIGALNALDTGPAADPSRLRARLSWRFDGVWRPCLHTDTADIDTIVARLDADRVGCIDEPALRFRHRKGKKDAVPEIRPAPGELREILLHWIDRATPEDTRTLRWFTGFISEGATDGGGLQGKPTALDFTAGQQAFLKAACDLVDGCTPDDLRVALIGPWTYEGKRLTMGWDNTKTSDYALRARNPSVAKVRGGNPGADWLALRGLGLLPTVARGGNQHTPGVQGRWKSGRFAWPVWTSPADREVAQALIMTRDLRGLSAQHRARRGIAEVFESRILRTDQGGYGSMTPAGPV